MDGQNKWHQAVAKLVNERYQVIGVEEAEHFVVVVDVVWAIDEAKVFVENGADDSTCQTQVRLHLVAAVSNTGRRPETTATGTSNRNMYTILTICGSIISLIL